VQQENNFLLRYGLTYFVTFRLRKNGERIFSIEHIAGRKMIEHAKTLIDGTYGEDATVVTV